MKSLALLCLSSSLLAVTTASAEDFGAGRDIALAENAAGLFGVAGPLAASTEPSVETGYRVADQSAGDQLLLASGLSAEYVTRAAGNHLDMMVFWPAENPTHMVACIEGKREEIAAGKFNPAIQSIDLANGEVRTLVRGMDRCDGIRTTAWGTILATEETDDGAAWEIIDPLGLDNAVISDREGGIASDPARLVRRPKLPVMAWEGLTVTPEGVVIGGDELRPGTAAADVDGGAMFKFVPAVAHGGGAIESLDQSPLADGRSYAMQVSCVKGKVQAGQGCEVGNALWVEIDPTNARADADAKGATGFYRPEDLHADPTFAGEGVRFCWTNTGNEGAGHYGEVLCAIDREPMATPQPDAEGKLAMTVKVNRFIEGDPELNSVDNLDFQPVTGILYVVEDHENGDVWACLPDGWDRDLKSDGCVRVLSVKDSSAEPTGFIFAPDGRTAYVSIQHSDDTNMPMVDDYATDDLIRITGFQAVAN
ncbi:PhoX family protein [Defluviimonas sp. WL0002]|uniref:PhoX family protein n=1 Tax=Albidovulum marisflavi TaxID=2984159 RepID=A0ABT2ZGD0_9RHOB|nr:PhoX family protein [Defluviimonas sp. WL0002]MCV2870197.1 PhoX family protein [Defluviimonas sp. WL0002]